MTSGSSHTAATLAEVVARELRNRGNAVRAEKEKAYLKSLLAHYGASVPDTRAVVRALLRGVELSHDAVIELAQQLWAPPKAATAGSSSAGESTPVHERRTAATMVLIQSQNHLGAGDADAIENLLHEAKTWALVDPLAGDLVGPLSERDADLDPVLERWARDDDFWIRRSALLAHLVPLGQGRGDFDRFADERCSRRRSSSSARPSAGCCETPHANAPSSSSTGFFPAPTGRRESRSARWSNGSHPNSGRPCSLGDDGT